jgi:aminotransferase
MQAANRMNSIPFSGIRKVFEQVLHLEKSGEKIIHMEIGRPDFDTPQHIKDAAVAAINQGKVHYTSNYGLLELRQAIADKLARDNNLIHDPETEITVTAGANQAVFIAMMAMLNPGDEVLIPEPCWTHYYYCAQLAGAVPVPVPSREENGFVPDPADYEALATARTKMVVINTPHNPTGAVITQDVLQDFADLAMRLDLLVLSDEIYEHIIYGGARHVSIGSLGGMKERTLTVNGFSKIYAMTGWRLGYLAAPKELNSAAIRVHQYTTVCATSFAQWGAVEALNGDQGSVSEMLAQFDARRKLVVGQLESMPGITLAKPSGTFYVFPNISSFGKTAEEITTILLEKGKLAAVPGPAFGDSAGDYIRLSYANSYDNLEIAMNSMAKVLTDLI